jgi:hypothetical protein
MDTVNNNKKYQLKNNILVLVPGTEIAPFWNSLNITFHIKLLYIYII